MTTRLQKKLASDILSTAEGMALQLPAEQKAFALRETYHARLDGTLATALAAGNDILHMYANYLTTITAPQKG